MIEDASEQPEQELAQELIQQLRRAAMNALGRREHSAYELRAKLQQRFKNADQTDISSVIERLQTQGLQCDGRFAEMFIRSRVNRGKGPDLIRRELDQHALQSVDTEAIFAQYADDWRANALYQLEKKYQPADMNDYATKSKALQFLYRKGYDSDTCSRAVEKFKRSHKEF